MADLKPAQSIPADMPQAVQPASGDSGSNYWWYCLEQNHPGSPTYTSQPLDLGRIFGTETDAGCPTCPACGREVSAVPCAGPRIPPAQIVDYARRYAESQIAGGIGR